MTAQGLTVPEHHQQPHSPALCLPSVRLPSLCLQCAVQRLEGACEPVALRKFIVGELTAIIEGDGQEFLSVVRCDTSFLERFLFAIAKQLHSENEQLQELAISVCMHLVQQDSSQCSLRWFYEEVNLQLLENLPAAKCLPHTILLGRLLHHSAEAACHGEWEQLQDTLVRSLALAMPSLQSALMYALVQLWKGLPQVPTKSTLKSAMKQLLQALQPSSSLDTMLNGFVLLKSILTSQGEANLADLFAFGSGDQSSQLSPAQPVTNLVKKGLLHQDALVQATAAQCCRLLLSNRTVAEWCLESDMAEYLLETLASKQELVVREVLSALCLLVRLQGFFNGHHAVFGLEPILDAVEVAKSKEIRLNGLQLLTGLLAGTTVSVRMISGVSMFGRVHRILAAICTADAESADNVRDVDFQIQRQGWIGMRHVWNLSHLPYDWPQTAMEQFLEAFQACILNDKLGFTRERCSLLEQAFLACAQVTHVFHKLMHVVAVAALATYLDQLLVVISHILQDSEYHQLSSEEGFAMFEALLTFLSDLTRLDHANLVHVALLLAGSDLLTTSLGYVAARSSSAAWTFVEQVCMRVAEYHAGLLDQPSDGLALGQAFSALKAFRPNCNSQDMLTILSSIPSTDRQVALSQAATISLLYTAFLHGQRIVPAEDLCNSLTELLLKSGPLELMTDTQWRQILYLISNLDGEEFVPHIHWCKAWSIVVVGLEKVAHSMKDIFSPCIKFLSWTLRTDLPFSVQKSLLETCLQMFAKEDLLASRGQLIKSYFTKGEFVCLVQATPASLPPLIEILSSSCETIVATACELLTDSLLNSTLTAPRQQAMQVQATSSPSLVDGKPSSHGGTSGCLHLLADLPARLEVTLIGHRVRPVSDHTCSAIIRLLAVHHRQQLCGRVDYTMGAVSLKLLCTVLSLVERHAKELMALEEDGITDFLASLEGARSALVVDLLSYLTLVATSCWLRTAPQAASILLSNGGLGLLLQQLVRHCAQRHQHVKFQQLISVVMSLLTQLIHCQHSLHLHGNWTIGITLSEVLRYVGSSTAGLCVTSGLCLAAYLRHRCHAVESCLCIAGLDFVDGSMYLNCKRESRAVLGKQMMATTMLATRLLLRDDPAVGMVGSILLHTLIRQLTSAEHSLAGLHRQWLSSPWLLHALQAKLSYFTDFSCSKSSAALLLVCDDIPLQWQKCLSSSMHTACAAAVLKHFTCAAAVPNNAVNNTLLGDSSNAVNTSDGAVVPEPRPEDACNADMHWFLRFFGDDKLPQAPLQSEGCDDNMDQPGYADGPDAAGKSPPDVNHPSGNATDAITKHPAAELTRRAVEFNSVDQLHTNILHVAGVPVVLLFPPLPRPIVC
ncbi:uncharacterized protein LOC135811756 isoform X2 [Sycon ciliatum]|uniref:uncharacterized protein LOC135811756 isoform X2 n=1 Tax=Sycon ciliatum TaxID=27933 RepID=UPI0031F64E87